MKALPPGWRSGAARPWVFSIALLLALFVLCLGTVVGRNDLRFLGIGLRVTMEYTFKRGFLRFVPLLVAAFVASPPILWFLRRCEAPAGRSRQEGRRQTTPASRFARSPGRPAARRFNARG